MQTIFFDECGYTGEDLMVTSQQVFTVASLCLEEIACTQLKNDFFIGIKAVEIKHRSIQKRARQRDMVINFLEYIKNNNLCDVKFGVMHKKYVLLTKIVDLLIEPIMYEDGYNLYERGGNIALSNVLFFCLPALISKEWFADMLQKFQNLLRRRDIFSYKSYFSLFSFFYTKNVEELFFMLKAWGIRRGFNGLDEIPQDALSVSISELFTITHKWSSHLKKRFIIIHDESSQIAKERWLWDKIVGPHMETVTVGYDRRKIEFPILAQKLQFESSQNWSGLQLADIMAGALARGFNWAISRDPQDSYGKKLFELFSDGFEINFVWPQLDVTPESLDTIGEDSGDVIEYLIDKFNEEVQ